MRDDPLDIVHTHTHTHTQCEEGQLSALLESTSLKSRVGELAPGGRPGRHRHHRGPVITPKLTPHDPDPGATWLSPRRLPVASPRLSPLGALPDTMGASRVKPMAVRCVAGEVSVDGHGVAVQGHVPVYRKQTQGRGPALRRTTALPGNCAPSYLTVCDC